MSTHYPTVFQRLVRAGGRGSSMRLSPKDVQALLELRDTSPTGRAYLDGVKAKQARCAHEWSGWCTHLWNYPLAGKADLQVRACLKCRVEETRREPEVSPF